jgi:tryptophan synthase alpha chain
VAARLPRIRRHVSIPVGVGLGIRDADRARRLASCADAEVIGSKLIETMETAVAEAGRKGLDAQAADAFAISAAADWLGGIRQALADAG